MIKWHGVPHKIPCRARKNNTWEALQPGKIPQIMSQFWNHINTISATHEHGHTAPLTAGHHHNVHHPLWRNGQFQAQGREGTR